MSRARAWTGSGLDRWWREGQLRKTPVGRVPERRLGARTDAGEMATTRRDLLLKLQDDAQRVWDADRTFEQDAPPSSEFVGTDGQEVSLEEKNKFLVTFPYPYMNGYLHLGHAFSMSKAEFSVAYAMLKGKRALFPFGFHCTGMPIQAAANKLRREMETYGTPPAFPASETEKDSESPSSVADEASAAAAKSKSTKSKAAAKQGRAKFQWEILQMSGIPDADIPRFAEALSWLEYFPQEGLKDLQAFGVHTDWRRSFITTDVNPYYDSFIRWQFNLLRKLEKIKFGKRNTIYSPLDGQACADHDRASGEGVGPQDYTIIKLEVITAPGTQLPAALEQYRDQKKGLYLAAATLRPETMYGQTNCWVQPDGEYGAFEVSTNGDVFICTERSARNMCYQGLSPEHGKVSKVCDLRGWDLIGLALRAPNAMIETVYVLPLLTVSAAKGTGVVTSVPSDAPDDFRGLQDLKEKPALRQKFGVKDEWVLPFEPVPIIDTPDFGPLAAVTACEQYKVQSQNDRDALAKAKEEVYKKGFYGGVLTVGPHKGESVEKAKPIIRDEMLAAGQAVAYAEPEKTVMSRSGDECVVAFMDQWYLDYGDAEWKQQAYTCLSRMNMYHAETTRGFEHVLGWLREWACSRSFGLGTKLPWDPQYVIESLSDSTIYMAYYAVAHLLQGKDNMNGKQVGPLGIRADQMTDEIWDFVILGKDLSDDQLARAGFASADRAHLDQMRTEVLFWYPMDLRVSGKDLIGNHLSFSIFNHCAIFPENKWPLGFRANGHMLINAEKMSKSTGNFLSLREAISMYSADGVRFALADAGDSVEDANFATKMADDAVLKLTTLISFVEEGMRGLQSMRHGEFTFYDRVFIAQIQRATSLADAAYAGMLYREALKVGFFELQSALGLYRVAVGADQKTWCENFHRDVFLKFVEHQILLITPLCPHTCEYLWNLVGKTIGKEGTVVCARWPDHEEHDQVLLDAALYLEALKERIRQALLPKKVKKGAAPPTACRQVRIFVATQVPEWQSLCLEVLKSSYDASTEDRFPKDLDKRVAGALTPEIKKMMKKVMPFVGMIRDKAKLEGETAFDARPKFDEVEVLNENLEILCTQLGVPSACVVTAGEISAADPAFEYAQDAVPGKPALFLIREE
ncbi:Leucine--tRNA ligase, cytoplasmic [Porphyridium purpureum]|uniref:leucine--tRNA ligase n=1 Tax=Porphyridium purpureum TaxID=35688 RepID=A0A5J4YXV7_PORPP|nr:Leucine--tRNA ligase, cytoplasmic [Porphyridium purpureum]|eukprot:POR8611..scf209_3